jgi:hypothetical protein
MVGQAKCQSDSLGILLGFVPTRPRRAELKTALCTCRAGEQDFCTSVFLIFNIVIILSILILFLERYSRISRSTGRDQQVLVTIIMSNMWD